MLEPRCNHTLTALPTPARGDSRSNGISITVVLIAGETGTGIVYAPDNTAALLSTSTSENTASTVTAPVGGTAAIGEALSLLRTAAAAAAATATATATTETTASLECCRTVVLDRSNGQRLGIRSVLCRHARCLTYLRKLCFAFMQEVRYRLEGSIITSLRYGIYCVGCPTSTPYIHPSHQAYVQYSSLHVWTRTKQQHPSCMLLANNVECSTISLYVQTYVSLILRRSQQPRQSRRGMEGHPHPGSKPGWSSGW